MRHTLPLSMLLMSCLSACSGNGTGTETEAELKAKAQAISKAGEARAQKIAGPLNVQAQQALAAEASNSANGTTGNEATTIAQ